MHISGLGDEWFPLIVNTLEELNATFDQQLDCHAAWIGGTTNSLAQLFDYSSSPEQYIPDNSGMYRAVNKQN